MTKRKAIMIVGVLVFVSVLSLIFYGIRVRAQNEIVTILSARLAERNVPLEEITVINQIPFDIEITIRSVDEGEDIDIVPLNIWNIYISRREAMLTEKYSFQLNSYTITLTDKNGNILSRGQLFSSDDRQPFPTGLSKLSDEETAKVLADKLTLTTGMTLENINVTTDIGRYDAVQYIALDFSVPDVDVANSVVSEFFYSLTPFLVGMNQDQGTRIAVCDINIYDGQGKRLIRHITDLEMTSETWWQAVEITAKWYPSPLPEMKDTPATQVTNTPPTIKDTPTPDDRNSKSTQNPYP